MAEQDFKRKLTAILSADAKGYSRLMRDDEEATVRTITAYRKAIGSVIKKHRGEVVDSPGDNILAEFASVVDAVRGAVEIQEELKVRNAGLTENRKMEFRIGINLGDIIQKDNRIYGDGVNVAARIEGLADPGGVCISRNVYDQVKKKLTNLGYEYIGAQDVKNISEPVRVYKVLMESEYAGKVIGEETPKPAWPRTATATLVVLAIVACSLAVWNFYIRRPTTEPASVEKMAFPLPDKPSIAVLPFVNMSDDPKQEYFSDGLTEQIISSLSKIPYLFIIARNSTFTYKGKAVKVQKVAEDLGVKYVMEGSVQKTPDKVRITAQLIDAITGHHIWSERYDRKLEDIFAIQDDITMEIMKAMQIKLTRGEQARLWAKHETANLEAYEKSQEARAYLLRYTKENNALGRQLLEEAIVLDPKFASAYAFLGWSHFNDARFGWAESSLKSSKMASEYAQKALKMDSTLDLARTLLSAVYLVKRQHDKAVVEAEKAVALNPGTAHSLGTLAGVLGCSGRWEDSIIYFKKAIRVDPFPPITYLTWLGRAYFMTGQYDEGIMVFKKALDRNPNYLPVHAFLAASYISLGKEPEAFAAAEEVLRINPKFSLESYAKTLPYKNKADIDRYIAALRKAVLPETVPLPLPDKPSIAVLPFDNLSGDPEQEYFSDGITEDLITDLSKISSLFVIARNSVFTYKGRAVKINEVGRKLGVRYVLEGSVRKANNRVRITAQLVDATTEGHLWAERYDRNLKDIFALQDEVTQKIVAALAVKLTEDEQKRLAHKYTDNMAAYDLVLKGKEYNNRFTKEANDQARQMYERAIELDPEFAIAYSLLALTHFYEWSFGWSHDPRTLEQAFELAQRAIAIDESLPLGHAMLGQVYLWKKQHDKAIAELENAIALSPSDAKSLAILADILNWNGRPGEAIGWINKAMTLNPMYPAWYLWNLGHAYFLIGHYEKAIEPLERARDRNPNFLPVHVYLAASYSEIGRQKEAQAEVAEIKKLSPQTSKETWRQRLPYKDQAIEERLFFSLQKAGLK